LRLLWDCGFDVVTKPRSVGLLDATFSVGRNRDNYFLIVESQGPNRNTDYSSGLEALLRALADLDATLLGATVASKTARRLPDELRRIMAPRHDFPLALRGVSDLARFRISLTSSAAATARENQSGGSGNPTKRLRIDFELPNDLRMTEVADALAEMGTSTEFAPREFRFQPAGPSQSTEAVTRKAVEATIVTRVHMDLQSQLYELMVKRHGRENVAAEQLTPSGRPADLVVATGEEYEIYEIKTALSPRDCVRQALGQLLEYAYWPGSPSYRALWVVGPSAIDSETQLFLDTLREQFSLPIQYLHQPPTAG
jgi:hypothetical protein